MRMPVLLALRWAALRELAWPFPLAAQLALLEK
jgi:hypothetical protein